MVDRWTESADKLTYEFTLRDGLLWRNAALQLVTMNGLQTTRGMPEIMAALTQRDPRASIRIALPIHDGYLALYGPDGQVAARIIENESGLNVRIMEPHASYVTNDDPAAVVDALFRPLEARREKRA